jgi:hypothetical protein
MHSLRSPHHLAPLVLGLALSAGCGDKESPADQKAAASDRKFDEPSPTPEPGPEPSTAIDPVEDWSDMPELPDAADTDGDTDGDEAEARAEAPPEAWPGPCAIRWSSGTQVRFEYAEDRSSGTVRIDRDGDRKSDICGRFELREGRTSKVEIDEGCNKKIDLEIVPEYDAKANLATAQYIPRGGEGETKTMTLITMPSFGGLDPGYPLQAARKDVELKVTRGLVRSARVKAPHAGPPTKVTLTYDKAGRLSRLDEDVDDDGTIDRRFNYTYDEVGNVTRITFRFGSGDTEQKGNARLDYGCWTKPTP